MVNVKDIAREIARIYCPLTPLGVDMLAGILVPMKFQKGETILEALGTASPMLAARLAERVRVWRQFATQAADVQA